MAQNILIVDDVELNIEMLSDIFEDEYEVLTATNGYEASEIISKNKEKISAILLDIFMPGIGGFDVLKGMKRDNLLGKIPVLMITTDDSQDLEQKVKEQTAKLSRTNHRIVSMLGNLVESRNLESGEHVQRVSGYTRELANAMMETDIRRSFREMIFP